MGCCTAGSGQVAIVQERCCAAGNCYIHMDDVGGMFPHGCLDVGATSAEDAYS